MSTIELKSEIIRLVNEIDGELMEDLLFSIKTFMRQQEQPPIDTNSEELTNVLNSALAEIGQHNLLSNDEILVQTRKWLTK